MSSRSGGSPDLHLQIKGAVKKTCKTVHGGHMKKNRPESDSGNEDGEVLNLTTWSAQLKEMEQLLAVAA